MSRYCGDCLNAGVMTCRYPECTWSPSMDRIEYDCLQSICRAMQYAMRWDWEMSNAEREGTMHARDYLSDRLWDELRSWT